MRLLTAAALAFVTVFNTAVVRADSSTFSEDEARPVLAAIIQKESQGKITIVSFKKTDGQKSEFAGIKAYQMDFEAQIQFQVNGSWLKGIRGDTRLGFGMDQSQINKGSWAEFNNSMQGGLLVSRGSRATISGVMTGQRTENGWRIEVLESHYVSSGPATTVQPAPQVPPGTGGENPMQSVPMQSANQQADVLALHNSITKAAANQFSKIIESESQGQIKRILKSFRAFQTEKIDTTGRDKYWMTYVTELAFLADGIWLERIPGPKSGQFHFAPFPLADATRPRGREVHTGDHAKIVGTLIAEKTETDWRISLHDAYPVSFKGPQQVEADAANTCINNLRLIESAKQQWALELRKGNSDIPVVSDILPFCGRGANGTIPTCPSGGTYTINAVGEKPQCSIPNHVLP